MVGLSSLAACSSAWSVRDGSFGNVAGTYSTADYRIITERTRSRIGDDQRVVCTEPSPDIAKAFSSAFSAKVSKGAESVGLTSNQAEAIAQLGKRYATIQLLRDIRFRDCEDYSNGIIDKVEYAYRLGRFSSLVVTLLGIEMVSGDNATPPPSMASPQFVFTNDASSNAASTAQPTAESKTQSNAAAASGQSAQDNQSNPVTSNSTNGTELLAAAAQSMSSVDGAVHTAKTSFATLPKKPSASEKLSIADFKTELADISATAKDLQSAWGAILKAKGQLDTTATTDLKKIQTEQGKLESSAASATAASKSANKEIRTVAETLSNSAQQLIAATTTLGKLKATPPSTNTGNGTKAQAIETVFRSVSDAQVKGIVDLQQSYLNQDDDASKTIPCAVAESDLIVDGYTHKANTLTAYQLYCLRDSSSGRTLPDPALADVLQQQAVFAGDFTADKALLDAYFNDPSQFTKLRDALVMKSKYANTDIAVALMKLPDKAAFLNWISINFAAHDLAAAIPASK